jgi:beta-glucanase (GH16 family)
MRSAASPPLTVNMIAPSSAAIDLADYSVVFEDEFNGSVLDRNSWKTSLPWGPDRIINREQQYFVNIFGNNPPSYDPFSFTGSTMKITGIDTPSDMLSQANNQPYLSGVITTADYFEMTYGYVEMNAKLASGTGLLSTFYLFNQDFDNNKPEIDIIEYIGSRPDKAYQTYHYFDSNRSRWASGENHSSPTMETVAASDLSAGYHTYSVLWEPNLMVWYIDDIEVRRVVGPRVSTEPMNIIAQLVVGSEWIGQPDANAIPATLEIDYIRAWQKN